MSTTLPQVRKKVSTRRSRPLPILFSQTPMPMPTETAGASDTPIISAIIAAAGAIIAAVAGPPIAAWVKSRYEKREKKFLLGLDNTIETIELLTAFQTIGAERIILWEGHNGGGLPSGGSPFYTSVVHKVIAPGHMDITANYHNILVDAHYIKMLSRAAADSERMAVLQTQKMPDCQLRRYYEAEGVVESLIFVLGVAKNSLYYLSVARYDRIFSEQEKTVAGLKAQTLWNKLQENKK